MGPTNENVKSETTEIDNTCSNLRTETNRFSWCGLGGRNDVCFRVTNGKVKNFDKGEAWEWLLWKTRSQRHKRGSKLRQWLRYHG